MRGWLGWLTTGLIALASCGADDSLHPVRPFVPSGSVTGRLCNRSTGAWVGGAWVAIGNAETITDPTGAFTVAGIPPGEHRMLSDDGAGFSTDRTVVVRSGRTTDIGVERCDMYRGTIEGRVCTLMAPAGLAGAKVRIDGASTVTNASGDFRLEAPHGRHIVRIVGSGVDDVHLVDVEPFATETIPYRCGATVIDEFVLPATPTDRADILFVVDNSSSMSDDQERLARSFETFFARLDDSGIDYRLAVTTTDINDDGAFAGPVVTPETPNAAETFAQTVQVGASGSSIEQGLACAELTFEGGADGHDFLRDDARVYLVFVSDEEDYSPEEVSHYADLFDHAAPNNHIIAIAGPPPHGCSSPGYGQPAFRYAAIADQLEPICQEDFGDSLQLLALQVVATAGEFPLSESPAADSLSLHVNGQLQPDERWWLEIETNTVRFNEPWLPAASSWVVATYVTWR